MMDSARILTIHIEEPKKKRDEEGEGEKEETMKLLILERFYGY